MSPHTSCCLSAPSRRGLLLSAAALCLCGAAHAQAPPTEVAGIAIPASPLARKAAALSRAACPPYLFNHCLRTFVFGALAAKKQNMAFNADEAFAAAALHDLGLLPAYESANASFEIDGADAAEAFLRKQGASDAAAGIVWHAVEMHDGKWALTKRQGPEAMLVSLGAGIDVDGPDPQMMSAAEVKEVLAAFPRLDFKRQFTGLLIGHCRRKPLSQRGTWLEGLCREQVPGAWTDTVENEIAKSGYAE